MHFAAEFGSINCITVLLSNDADPSLKTTPGIPPFRLCENREVRSSFWNFRAAEPEKYNYNKSEIPNPSEIKENPTARKRPKKKKKPKEKEPEVVKNPCDDCGIEIIEIPFKYSDFKFCTTRCLRAHRFSNK